MGWTKIEPSTDVRETDLQDCFDHWEDFRDQIAGVPTWLREAMKWPRVDSVSIDTALVYTNHPDVVRENRDANEASVIELKYGEKYEPLVVAQVLCAAYWLEEKGRYRSVHPGIVGQYSVMNRVAIQRLRDKGLRDDVLRYAEVQIFGPEGERLFFFDAPFSKRWERRSPPAVITDEYGEEHTCWYYVEDSATWYGFASPQGDQKPLFIEGAWCQVSAMNSGYLGWSGHHNELGSSQVWRE